MILLFLNSCRPSGDCQFRSGNSHGVKSLHKLYCLARRNKRYYIKNPLFELGGFFKEQLFLESRQYLGGESSCYIREFMLLWLCYGSNGRSFKEVIGFFISGGKNV